jgi:hypothetical protein
MFYINPVFTEKFLYPVNRESKLMQTYHYELEAEKKKKKEIKVTVFWDVTMCHLVHKKEDRKLNVHT